MRRVLFVHGKATFLRNNKFINLSVPHMKHTNNFCSSLSTILKELYEFNPEIIVAVEAYGL